MTIFGKERDPDRLEALGFAGQVTKPIWSRNLKEALLSLGSASPGSGILFGASSPVSKSLAGSNRTARILLAEDNLTNQIVAQAMLDRLGYNVDMVATGVEAINALRDTEYDLLLMDCEMPEMDGYEASRRIRDGEANSNNSTVPIVAVTADAMSGDRDRCLKAGISDYLAKPVELQRLKEVLEKWLAKAAANAGLKPAIEPQSGSKTEVLFNQSEMLARLMGNKGLAAKVIAGFLKDAPVQLQILRHKLAKGDAAGVRLQAHTLKGAAATISGNALRKICSEAQEAAAAGELGRVSELLPRIEEQFELLHAELIEAGWV
jgi:CheY-like chemotaxis protein/HPt (histidine-containing phosphotransfer) domain-containing protein